MHPHPVCPELVEGPFFPLRREEQRFDKLSAGGVGEWGQVTDGQAGFGRARSAARPAIAPKRGAGGVGRS